MPATTVVAFFPCSLHQRDIVAAGESDRRWNVRSRRPVGRSIPMSQPDFVLHYAELKREIDALEAELAEPKASKHFADVKPRIESLYEELRTKHMLLHTVLGN